MAHDHPQRESAKLAGGVIILDLLRKSIFDHKVSKTQKKKLSDFVVCNTLLMQEVYGSPQFRQILKNKLSIPFKQRSRSERIEPAKFILRGLKAQIIAMIAIHKTENPFN